MPSAPAPAYARREMTRVSTTTTVLMAFAAVTFALASTIHFGVPVAGIADPFPGAAVPEAIIAAVVAAGAACAALRLGPAWWVALGTTAVAILGTAFGLSITVRGGAAGDIAYHVGILAVLLAVAALLVGRDRRESSPPGRTLAP